MSTTVEEAFSGSPYLVNISAQDAIQVRLAELDHRVQLLRANGQLSVRTLEEYYGRTRIEQVTESNALEGSTLTLGETELAVVKGVTITGHDPGFIRDARDLNRALSELSLMARGPGPTNLSELKRLHELVLGERKGAGEFRQERVRIRGSEHTPPKSWQEVMTQMEAWEAWSLTHTHISPLLRATTLHAWLAHTHPFLDGNGRTARAISNLELVRGGYPPIIIKKKERARYLEALAESDGGELGPFLDLVLERVEVSLDGLVQAAQRQEGYSEVAARFRENQQRHLRVWSAGVQLLHESLLLQLAEVLPLAPPPLVHIYTEGMALEVEEFIQLCNEEPKSQRWLFSLDYTPPLARRIQRVLWAGWRSRVIKTAIGAQDTGGPSLYWSTPNPTGYPRWRTANPKEVPRIQEMTLLSGQGDKWVVRDVNEGLRTVSTLELGQELAQGLVELAMAG